MTDPIDSPAAPLELDRGLEPAAGTPLVELATEEPAGQERTLPGRRARVVLELAGVQQDPFEVRIDNRDYLRWDKTAPRQKWGSGRDVPFLMATFLAWSAADRQRQTTLKWAEFEAAALEVENLEEEDQDLARPTR